MSRPNIHNHVTSKVVEWTPHRSDFLIRQIQKNVEKPLRHSQEKGIKVPTTIFIQ